MGAMARSMLITAAARHWNIPEAECETRNHFVIHRSTGNKLFYGELAAKAAGIAAPENPKLKSPEDFVYIGKGLKCKRFYNR